MAAMVINTKLQKGDNTMFVYKIFNEDTQRFFSSNNKRTIWISPSGVATAVKYAKERYKK